METFYVELSRRAEKEYAQLEGKLKNRVRKAIDILSQNRVPVKELDIEKITGTESDYRIRIQTHRIQYTVHWKEKKVTIFKIERKKDRTYK